MTFIMFLELHPLYFLFLTSVLGLFIGSFLNVVIYRFPIMMQREWRKECIEFLELEKSEKTKPERFNLWLPRSQCPHCKHTIPAWQNIPVISYLLLKGCCAFCQEKISIRYPFIELITMFCSLTVALHFGLTGMALAALLFSWFLIVLTVIDIDHQLLPDNMTLVLLWMGLGLSLFGYFTKPSDAIIGALIGYLSLWFFAHAFKLIAGKDGMGHGDFKLFAAIGAWLGWQLLPFVIIAASFVGAIVGIALIVFTQQSREKPIPFGPYLAVAGWIAMLWGHTINSLYLQVSGLT